MIHYPSDCRSDNMGDKKRDIKHKFLLEVIATYESLPELWKIKSGDNMNRDKKAYEYNVLLQKYKEHFLDKTLEEPLPPPISLWSIPQSKN